MEIMQFRLVTTARGQSSNCPLQTIKQNTDFDLVLTVRDLRPPGTFTYNGKPKALPRGVFAAYCFVQFPPEIPIVGIVPHSSFQEGLLVQNVGSSMIKCGAFSRNLIGLAGEVSMFRFQCRTQSIYDPTVYLNFGVEISGIERPMYAPLVYGLSPDVIREQNLPASELGAVKDEEVRIVPATLKVTQ